VGLVEGIVTGIRQEALSAAIRLIADRRLRGYGSLGDVHVDVKRRSLAVSVILDGETEPITLAAERYEIVCREGSHGIIVHGVTASRKWVENLARTFLEGRFIALPEAAAKALKCLA